MVCVCVSPGRQTWLSSDTYYISVNAACPYRPTYVSPETLLNRYDTHRHHMPMAWPVHAAGGRRRWRCAGLPSPDNPHALTSRRSRFIIGHGARPSRLILLFSPLGSRTGATPSPADGPSGRGGELRPCLLPTGLLHRHDHRLIVLVGVRVRPLPIGGAGGGSL